MGKIIFYIMIIALVTSQTGAQGIPVDSFSLHDVIRITIERNSSIKQASKFAEAAGARTKLQQTSYAPEIEADAAYARIGPVAEFDLPGGLSAKLYPENNYDAHVTLHHTLYDFGKRQSQSEVSESYEASAKDNIELIKTNLTFQTVQLFYSVLFLRESLHVKDEQMQDLTRHLQSIKNRIESGTATDFDYLTTQVRLSAIENQKTEILNDIRKQELQLKNIMGMPPGNQLNIKGDFNYKTAKVNSDSLAARALAQRYEIKLAHDTENSLLKQKQSVRLGDMPSVNVSLLYGLKNGYIPNLDVLRGNWNAALLFRYPIYNGSRVEVQEEEVEANYQSALEKSSEISLAVQTEISRAISDVTAAKQQLETVKLQLQHAQKSLERAELQYQNGVIRNLDLLDAQTGLTEARLSELQIIYRNIMANYMLQKAVGDKLW